jgi:hypothetical protein
MPMTSRPVRDGKRPSAFLTVAGVAASVPVLVWWAIGDVSAVSGPDGDYLYGPYDIGVAPGRVALVVAAVALVVTVTDLLRRQRHGEFGWAAWSFVACIAVAGALGAAAWRLATAGVDGANIGGGGAVLLGPLVIGGLLVIAMWLPDDARPVAKVPYRAAWTVVVLAAPVLFVVLF